MTETHTPTDPALAALHRVTARAQADPDSPAGRYYRASGDYRADVTALAAGLVGVLQLHRPRTQDENGFPLYGAQCPECGFTDEAGCATYQAVLAAVDQLNQDATGAPEGNR